MRTPDGVFLSKGCPATGTYQGELLPENFVVYTNDGVNHGRDYEFVAEFVSSPDHETISDLGADAIGGSTEAKHLASIAERFTERELGAYFCSKVAECKGPEAIDGPPHCPALNNIQLRKLL